MQVRRASHAGNWRKCIWDIHERQRPKLVVKQCGVQCGLCRIWIQRSSATQSCPALCDPMDCSMPVLPIHHQLPEFIQTHVHWVGEAIQPSHPLSSPSSPAFNLSQRQGLFNESALRRSPNFKCIDSSILYLIYFTNENIQCQLVCVSCANVVLRYCYIL